ncbi:DUF1566 domain-containing protein, partial [Chromatium okenii]|uniref:Lcl domain-containing protein n=1 Tax=Chromatium okenii TaxID=61644 RepID=UPI0026F158A8
WVLVVCFIGGLSFPAGAATYTVKTTADSGDDSLRQAIISANATADDDTIEFSSVLTGLTIALTSGQIDITNPVIINGNGVTISGGNLYRVFEINNSAAEVGMNNLKIVNGHENYGSGIYNSGELSLNHCTLTGNTSTDVSWGGGAIKNLNILSVKNSTISTNDATVGLGGGILNFGSTVVENSTFNANNATQGGGIYNSDGSDLTITNSTFSGNSVMLQGGGIFNAGSAGSVTTKNSTFSENHADDQGGGIYNDGTLTIVNSIVSANNSGGSGPEIFNGTYNGGGTFSPSGNNVFGFEGGVGITTDTDIFTGDCHCVIPTTDSIADIIGALTNNGGPTQTRAPVISGLAHNTGDNASAIGLAFDQRGNQRIVGIKVDIGAVEIGPINDTGITSCSNETQNGLACPVTGFPRQDAEFGSNGFDFTAIDASGNTTTPTSGANPHPCVLDNVTGLIWEVKTDDGGLRDKDWTYSWYSTRDGGTVSGTSNCKTTGRCDTEKFVADVNAAGLCGFNDWRMPNEKELMGIVNRGRTNPAIDITYFPNTVDYWFCWSGSPYAGDANSAWYVAFDGGYANYYNRDYDHHVRLVRGGQSFDSFVDNNDGTVTQLNTGLMWAKCSEGQTGTGCTDTALHMNWSAALTAANNSNLGGYNDWRLPNFKELQALMDYSRYNPAIDTNYFPNTPNSLFWSGSPAADHYAWYVHLYHGSAYGSLRTDALLVRLVRGGQSFNTFALTANKTGTGSGTVTSSDGFTINCGTTCFARLNTGTSITLTATPNTSATFNSWTGCDSTSGNDCTVTMSVAKTVNANFTATATYSITATANPIAGGSVSCSPNPVISGNTANCTATPNTGYTFSHFSGDCNGATCALTNVTA